MVKDCWSLWIILLEGEDFNDGKNSSKTFNLLTPHCWPESLSLNSDLESLKERLGVEFELALMIQIEIVDKSKENEQYEIVKNFVDVNLEDYFIAPINDGLFRLTRKEMFACLISLFRTKHYEIVSVNGNWKEDFTDSLNRSV